MAKKRIPGLFVSSAPNISYLSGSPSRDSFLLVTQQKCIYFTDGRYYEQARNYLKGLQVKRIANNIGDELFNALKILGLKELGFEEEYLSFAGYRRLESKFGKDFVLTPTRRLVEELRVIKDKYEIIKIKKAAQIAKKALSFIEGVIKPGIKEIEVAAELERFIRYNGAGASAFDIIVATGKNSSYPHHQTSSRVIQKGEVVLVDMGVDYCGYKSDLTRVFLSDKINTSVRKVYDIVRGAQQEALKKLRPGLEICQVDKAARSYIQRKGLGKYFVHALGHGLGLEVHEAPGISSQAQGKIQQGMVFTIEPAVYIPHKFGIRLEEMILTNSKNCEVI
ncbi:MAG: aminopeptidase P family protein [Candidatus Omnitrophica bacterium]|nr:aminopeptidase P family protein [Candidatus Omnitrophota bacterium]